MDNELKSIQAAANEETKSSAGDKYETGRAMLMLEKDKIASQIREVEKMISVLSKLDPKKTSETVDLGSLVETDSGWYYISVALGKIDIKGDTVFAISPVSPIGRLLMGMSADDAFEFNGRKMTVISVI